jgi:hypothetical protein
MGTIAEEFKDRIYEYFANHNLPEPCNREPAMQSNAHTIADMSKDSIVYLATNKNTREIQNIILNHMLHIHLMSTIQNGLICKHFRWKAEQQ